LAQGAECDFNAYQIICKKLTEKFQLHNGRYNAAYMETWRWNIRHGMG